MSNKVYVATYGSLRQRMQNYHVNELANATLVGTGTTHRNIDLYRYRGAYFPSVSLKHDANGLPVVVDVFETTQAGLEGPYDRLEGYPDFYNRSEVDVLMPDGNTVTAWIYHIDEEQEELVESGDWCLHNNANYYNVEEEESND